MTEKLSNHRKLWAQQDIRQLKVLLKKNTPIQKIGRMMGRTIKSIYSKAHSEGISLKQRKELTHLSVIDIGMIGVTTRREIYNKHTSISDVIKDFARIDRTRTKSIIDIFARSFEPIRHQQMGIINNLTSLGDSASIMRNIAHANNNWINLICQSPANQFLKQMQQTHKSWLVHLRPTKDRFTQLQTEVNSSLSGITHQLTIAERLFSRIDINSFQKFSIPKSHLLQFDKTMNDLTKSYRVLSDSLKTHHAFVRLPTFTLPEATRELVTTGKVLYTIIPPSEFDAEDKELIQSIDDVQQETSDVLMLLQGFDLDLVKPYIGAREALLSNNADRVRHTLISLREFWTHLLGKLAPKEMVVKWMPERKAEYIHEGNPTRKARIHYIFRNLNCKPLSAFFDKDTNSLIELINILNRVHELKPGLKDKQLRALISKSDSWVMYLLKIYFENTNNSPSESIRNH